MGPGKKKNILSPAWNLRSGGKAEKKKRPVTNTWGARGGGKEEMTVVCRGKRNPKNQETKRGVAEKKNLETLNSRGLPGMRWDGRGGEILRVGKLNGKRKNRTLKSCNPVTNLVHTNVR